MLFFLIYQLFSWLIFLVCRMSVNSKNALQKFPQSKVGEIFKFRQSRAQTYSVYYHKTLRKTKNIHLWKTFEICQCLFFFCDYKNSCWLILLINRLIVQRFVCVRGYKDLFHNNFKIKPGKILYIVEVSPTLTERFNSVKMIIMQRYVKIFISSNTFTEVMF